MPQTQQYLSKDHSHGKKNQNTKITAKKKKKKERSEGT